MKSATAIGLSFLAAIFALGALFIFTPVHRFFGFYGHDEIVEVLVRENAVDEMDRLIREGNVIMERWCEKHGFKKRFGLLGVERAYNDVELSYVVFDDKETLEVNITFDQIWWNYNGYDSHPFEGYEQFQ